MIALIVALVLLGFELSRSQFEIQPFAMPKSLAEAGHAPEVAAARLRDVLAGLAEDAATAGGKTLTVSMRGDMPDIVVPTVGLSLSTVKAYLQRLPGYPAGNMIGGELTLSEQRVSMLLRLNGAVIFRSREPVAIDRLDDLWRDAAQAAMLEISPYRAMLAMYDTNPEAAVELADKIIRRYPADDENVGWARLVKGLELFNSDQSGAAEEQFRGIVEQADADRAPFWNSFAAPASFVEPALFYLGAALLNGQQAAEAEPVFRRASRLDRGDPGARFMLGQALASLNRTAEADVEFSKASTIYQGIFASRHGPKSARSHIGFGFGLLFIQGKKEEGLAQLRWAVELDPASDYAHRQLCDGLRQAKPSSDEALAKKLLDEALQHCVLATQRGPHRFENQISLALVWMERNEPHCARQAADEALRLAPGSPLVHQTLAKVQQKAGEPDLAEASYRRAIELAPKAAAR
ncbi:MAG TPA: hypothetical protein VFQ87_04145 [Bradyrhizobium sp.]|jgi:Tfp pilus assembly protein PilF|nr:hypothetical protein [Bradyrhizobium sp.]